MAFNTSQKSILRTGSTNRVYPHDHQSISVQLTQQQGSQQLVPLPLPRDLSITAANYKKRREKLIQEAIAESEKNKPGSNGGGGGGGTKKDPQSPLDFLLSNPNLAASTEGENSDIGLRRLCSRYCGEELMRFCRRKFRRIVSVRNILIGGNFLFWLITILAGMLMLWKSDEWKAETILKNEVVLVHQKRLADFEKVFEVLKQTSNYVGKYLSGQNDLSFQIVDTLFSTILSSSSLFSGIWFLEDRGIIISLQRPQLESTLYNYSVENFPMEVSCNVAGWSRLYKWKNTATSFISLLNKTYANECVGIELSLLKMSNLLKTNYSDFSFIYNIDTRNAQVSTLDGTLNTGLETQLQYNLYSSQFNSLSKNFSSQPRMFQIGSMRYAFVQSTLEIPSLSLVTFVNGTSKDIGIQNFEIFTLSACLVVGFTYLIFGTIVAFEVAIPLQDISKRIHEIFFGSELAGGMGFYDQKFQNHQWQAQAINRPLQPKPDDNLIPSRRKSLLESGIESVFGPRFRKVAKLMASTGEISNGNNVHNNNQQQLRCCRCFRRKRCCGGLWYRIFEEILFNRKHENFYEIRELQKSFRAMKETIHTFKAFVPMQVVDQIIRGKGREIYVERRCVTIFFSDIQDFTTIAEELPPKRLMFLLERYLDAMTRIVSLHNGCVTEFIGDAIMGVWNAPEEVDNHQLLACRAAIAQQFMVTKLNETFANSDLPHINVRMGIHTGDVLAGNIGSPLRMKYGLVGDDVNLASRLEGLNKHYGTRIIISEKTHRDATENIPEQQFVQQPTQFSTIPRISNLQNQSANELPFKLNINLPFLVTRMLDKVIVKGRTTFIGIYELVGTRSSLSPEEIRRVSEYNDIYKLAESVFNNPSMWASNGGTTSRKNSKAHELASIAAANRANIKPFSQLANVPITDISPENIETEPNPNSPTRITFEETGNRIDSQKSIPRQTRTESDYSSSRDLFELSKQTDQSIWNILLNDYQSDRSSSNPNPETIDKEFSNSEEFQESQKMLVYISEAINRASFAFEGESAESMMNSNFSITDENNELDLLSSYSQKRNSETLKREKAIGQAESASFNEEASRKRRERFHSANGQFNEASSFGKLVARMERYVENYPDDKPGQLLLSKILAKTFGVPTKMTEK